MGNIHPPLQVSVGWGSKQTQFHGSEGKAGRGEVVGAGEADPEDDQRVRVSWRGDGEMFAVSFLMPGSAGTVHRRLRVLDRSGGLYSLSQNMPGLQWTAAWRPSGSVIAAAVRRIDSKLAVTFFEKNGLEHGGFPLAAASERVTGLYWSPDSLVLAVAGPSSVSLYTSGNYHWYLKQVVELGAGGGRVQGLQWSEDSCVLRCLVTGPAGAELHRWRLGWSTVVSPACRGSLAVCCVVAGRGVRVTPWAELTVPPPSSAATLACPAPVTHVLTHPGHVDPAPGDTCEGEVAELRRAAADVNSVLAVTSAGVHVFVVDTELGAAEDDTCHVTQNTAGPGYRVRHSCHAYLATVLAGAGLHTATNPVWLGGQLLACRGRQLELHGCQLRDTAALAAEVVSLTAAGAGAAVAQLEDGSLVRVRVEAGRLGLEAAGVRWPGLATTVLSCDQGVLGLTARFQLYLGSQQLAGNVTSACLHSSFLLLTTLDHQLLAVPLDQLGRGAAALAAASTRRVERGSRLVAVAARGSKTVLQMPRGNVEVIHPRSLTILLLAELLDTCSYKEAFLLARTQRINLNLLVDHDEDRFLANLGLVVEQISKPDHLTIFIVDLQEEDVCLSLYSDQYKVARSGAKEASRGGKVARVCTRMRQEMEGQDARRFLLPILATYVRDGRNLEEALSVIKSYKDAGVKSLVDDGLRFLATMVDINVLFNVALGTYDLQMVVMVAEKSQKDPKEYLPFLNNFRKMDENYRKFSIDQHLGRHEAALRHLAACGPERWAECRQHVVRHRLYKQALGLLPRPGPEHGEVAASYAEYLEGKKYHEEASLMYQRAGHAEAAVRTAAAALCWQRAGHLARSAGWSPEQLGQLYRQLAQQLETAGRCAEAARLLRECCGDGEEGVAVLVRGQCWAEAVAEVQRLGRADLVTTHLGPALEERRDTLVAGMEDTAAALARHTARLETIVTARTREMAAARGEAAPGAEVELGEAEDRNLEDADMFSDTTSVRDSVASSAARSKSTLKTRTTNRSKSSKNRRKQERKVYTTKEGSLHEDLGIIAAVHDLMSAVAGVRAEVRELVRAAAEVDRGDLVPAAQAAMAQLLALVERLGPAVWRPEDADTAEEKFGPEHTVEDILRGRDLQQTEYRPPLHILPPHLRYPPVIKKDDTWKLEIY